MECTEAQPLLAAYLDGELERAPARDLEAHLDACAGCRAELAQLDDVRRALRSAAPRYAAPPELRARIAADARDGADALPRPAAGPATPPRATSASWWRFAAALVIAFAAGGGIVDLWNSGGAGAAGAQATLAHDLFTSHWRALAAASPVDVVSSDRHTVKPWFAGKVPQSPPVADFADAGFALVGGRIDYVAQQRVPVLVYRHGQHLIDLFVLPPAAGDALGHGVQRQGYSIETVMLGGQPAAIVSDTDAQELAKFAALVAAVR
jgi:anti-sigma factor (TIGR02949 family)